jgi:uncharacterized protein
MEFEWDLAKSERNRIERGLPFELALVMFDSPVVETIDGRRDYGEVRVRAIGVVESVILHCAYADRGSVRRIISLRHANRRERDVYRATYAG